MWRVAVVVLLVLVAAGLGVGWAKVDGGPAGSAAARAPARQSSTLDSGDPESPEGWRRVLSVLDARRGLAFAHADATLLDRVYLAGSRPLAADVLAVRSLAAAGATAPGVRHEVTGLRVDSADSRHAELQITDRMPAYRIVGRGGAVLRSVPSRVERAFRVGLVGTEQGWRIVTITAVQR